MFATYSHGTNPILVRLLKSKKGCELKLSLEEIHSCAETESLDLSITFYKCHFKRKEDIFKRDIFLTCTSSCAHEKFS